MPSAAVLILFSCYNIYTAIGEISAQQAFSSGNVHYSAGDIEGFIKDMDNALRLNPQEPYYKYEFASKLNVYCSGLGEKNAALKFRLLEKAKELAAEAETKSSSRMNCMALRSLIELGLGNEQEAFKIRDEMYKIDSTQVAYRTNLAVYYLNQNKFDDALYEINTVLSWDIKNIYAFTAKIMYYLRTGNNTQAAETCRELLAIDPQNSFARRTLAELTVQKK